MKWFKHSSTALNDAKIEKLIMKYGIEGYGVYFAIVEMIAQEIDTNKVSCELEHDYELLAYKFRVDKKRLEEIVKYCIELRLFLFNDKTKRIRCLKILLRLDNTLSQNATFKETLRNFKLLKENESNFNLLVTEEIRLEENRRDKKRREEIRRDTERNLKPKNKKSKKENLPDASHPTPAATLKKFKNKINEKRWGIYEFHITDVIKYYNEVRARSRDPSCENYVKLLGALFEQGYTPGQCKKVVYHRWEEWKDDEKMYKFHEPETLFAYDNFLKYLPQAEEQYAKMKKEEQIKISREEQEKRFKKEKELEIQREAEEYLQGKEMSRGDFIKAVDKIGSTPKEKKEEETVPWQ